LEKREAREKEAVGNYLPLKEKKKLIL